MRGALGSNATIWFDLNNLGLALRIGLKLAIWPFETSVWKRLKWKVGQFWELSFTFVQVIRKKLVRDLLPPLPSWIGLNIYIYIYVYDMINFLYYDMNKKITQELCFKLIWSNWLQIRLKALQQQLVSVISFSTFTP